MRTPPRTSSRHAPRRPGHRPSVAVVLAAVAALALVLTACGGDESPAADPAPTVDAPSTNTGEAEPDAEPETEPAREAEAPEPDDEPPVGAPDLTVAVALTTVAELGAPIAADVGPDEQLYLADRGGTVHRLTDDGVSDPVVDLSDETTTDSERGLLGIAFAADGSELYLSYTDRGGDTTLDAVTVVDGVPDPDQRRTVFTLDQPYGNHNGGDVQIGPDGLVYLGLGDGGGGGDPLRAGQDLTTPLGALLRIDPQGADPYGIPGDNPFLDVDGAAGEIYAYGLRNPWRFSFDPDTGDAWIADVGQNTREEVNRVPFADLAGANFGWNLMEGTLEFEGSEPDDHVTPIYEYDTNGPEGCAVTGGVVYRGSAIPELVGAYLYSDACNGAIRALAVDADGEVVEQADLGIDGGRVVAFGVDADGEVLVFDLGGTVGRIVPAG
jgi:glucose/arabinose dehydrogenase